MIGQKLAHYEIVESLGQGGMGAVYLARDPKLGRDVAIKVLNERMLANPEARARFEREARAVAALSHPNILAIHDFGESEGRVFAVTERLEGSSLQDRLREGPMPVRSALELAAQIADGLAAAHDKGIVHRDLKPANLWITPEGRAKILDFGLAKASDEPGDDRTIGATVAHETTPGTVLGTVRYMSPEQVRGESVDARSDIFSFGTVLWEMLSGTSAFDRGSTAESMSAILKEDLDDLSVSDERIPPFVDRILRRCVEKAPAMRFQTAHDLGFALRSVSDSSSSSLGDLGAMIDAPAPSRPRPIVPVVAALVVGLVLGGLAGNVLRPAARSAPVKIMPLTQSGTDSSPSIAPDGNTIAFMSDRDGTPRIWLRQMQGGLEAPLTAGPDGDPHFSPDGSSVLFIRREGLRASAYRQSIVGGGARKLIDNVQQARWSPDGETVGFLRVEGDAAQGTSLLGTFDPGSGVERTVASFEEKFIYGLRWSPDGRWLTGTMVPAVLNNTDNRIVLVDVNTGETRYVWRTERRMSGSVWTPDGEGIVVATSTSLLGDQSSPLGLVERIDPLAGTSEALFWVQSVYGGGSDYVVFDFVDEDRIVFDEILWFGSLSEVAIDGERDAARRLTTGNSRDRQPVYSPDGTKLAFSSNRSGNLDLWMLDLRTDELSQLTDDESDDWDPAFSHDGSEMFWSTNRTGHLEIWASRTDGSGARQITNDGVDAENPTDTADGEWIVYGSGNPARDGIWKIHRETGEEVQIASGSYLIPEVSPSGRYVAYLGNDTDQAQSVIFVSDLETDEMVWTTTAPFRSLQDVINPGRPRWLPDESALVFVASEAGERYTLYAQDFRPGEDTRATRREVFETAVGRDIESFGISPDGMRIVIAEIAHRRTLKLAEDFR